MSEEPVSARRGMYERRQSGEVTVVRGVPFPGADEQPLEFDLYSSPSQPDPRPCVVLVNGYPDPGFQRVMGCAFKDLGATVSWARLIAMSGLSAIAYANRRPQEDLDALLRHLAASGRSSGVDPARVGVLACSGHVPLALSALARSTETLACAAMLYGYMVDADGQTGVADAQAQFRFANPGVSMSAFSSATPPVMIVRAGRDEMPRLNESIDWFTAEALRRNVPLTLINHPDAPHAFELHMDDARTGAVIRQVLGFLSHYLLRA